MGTTAAENNNNRQEIVANRGQHATVGGGDERNVIDRANPPRPVKKSRINREAANIKLEHNDDDDDDEEPIIRSPIPLYKEQKQKDDRPNFQPAKKSRINRENVKLEHDDEEFISRPPSPLYKDPVVAKQFLEQKQRDKQLHMLQFLCRDEFREPLEWHILDRDATCLCVMSSDYVQTTLLGPSRYTYMMQHSMSKYFTKLRYNSSASSKNKKWTVSTFNGGPAPPLDEYFVTQSFRPEFLHQVKQHPAKFHKIEPWCRVFPSTTIASCNSLPENATSLNIRFGLPGRRDPILEWKLLYAFCSALHCMPGLREEARALQEAGGLEPSDDQQIARLQRLVTDHVPRYRLEERTKEYEMYREQDMVKLHTGMPLVMEPKLARGSHVTCFLVLYQNGIFEPTLPNVLPLSLENLGICCGGMGEFLGVKRCWKMVPQNGTDVVFCLDDD